METLDKGGGVVELENLRAGNIAPPLQIAIRGMSLFLLQKKRSKQWIGRFGFQEAARQRGIGMKKLAFLEGTMCRNGEIYRVLGGHRREPERDGFDRCNGGFLFWFNFLLFLDSKIPLLLVSCTCDSTTSRIDVVSSKSFSDLDRMKSEW